MLSGRLHFSLIICRASLAGMFVKRDSTSKLTNISVGWSVTFFIFSAKSCEFFTFEAASSVYNYKNFSRCLARFCVVILWNWWWVLGVLLSFGFSEFRRTLGTSKIYFSLGISLRGYSSGINEVLMRSFSRAFIFFCNPLCSWQLLNYPWLQVIWLYLGFFVVYLALKFDPWVDQISV